jgi:hypothetical protein
MEYLSFFQEPLKPAPFKPEVFKFLENTTVIYPGVMSELSTLYERENDRVLEAGKDGSNPVQRERVFREHVVGLHYSTSLLSVVGLIVYASVKGVVDLVST